MPINHESVINVPIEQVFAWHENPGAMQRLLPPWQPVTAVSAAKSLKDGRAVLGLPAGVRLRAEHQAQHYVPQRLFVDELRLPAALSWRHEHHFESLDSNRTRVSDSVETNLPATAVQRLLEYRHRQLAEDLAAHQAATQRGVKSQKIAVTGASGLVGKELCAFLESGGHQVIRLVRRSASGAGERTWNPQDPSHESLAGCDAVIHLAGASIAGRFTEKHRRNIAQSRIEPTRKLAVAAARAGVRGFISASAIGIYGAQAGPSLLDEDASGGDDFLAEVVRDWEAAAREPASGQMRRVQVRTGLVQSPRGGTLGLLKPLYQAGLGGKIGNGEQWQSWIGLDDLLDIYYRALWDENLQGPVNAVAPTPVRNREYSATLAAVLHRPEILPVPAFAPGILLGKQGAELLALASQRVTPKKLTDLGHRFRSEELADALGHCLGRS